MLVASKEKWDLKIAQALGPNYVRVSSQALSAIHLVIFIHKSLAPQISDIGCSYVATGVSNVIGNKGAVGISFQIGDTKMLCISCHLASGQDQIEKRH